MGMKNIRTCVFASICFMILVSNSAASEISNLRISQVNAKLPIVKTYLDISDASGAMVQGILPEQLTVTIGAKTAEVKSIVPFEESDEGIAYILLIDISKSLKETQFIKIREALNAWIDDMAEKDRALIMTFGTKVTLVQDFTPDKEILKTKVGLIKPSDNDTQLHLGLSKAMETGRRTDTDLPTRRVIVTMSDGDNDFAGGMTKQEVIDRIKEEQIPIYSIGFYKPPYSNKKEEYLKILGGFSRTSGGEYYKAGNRSFLEMYTAIRQRIRQVYIAELLCNTCTGDGRKYRLQMNISSGHKSMTDGKDIRLLPGELAVKPEPESHITPEQADPSIQEAEPPEQVNPAIEETEAPEQPIQPAPVPQQELSFLETQPVWMYAAGGCVVLLLILLLLIQSSRKKGKQGDKGKTFLDDSSVSNQHETYSENVLFPSTKVRLTSIGIDDPNSPYMFQLSGPVVIGRNKAKCDIEIAGDDEISGRHCQMIHENDLVYVIDLDSTNGTIVNGVPVTGKQKLEEGDMLLMGGTEFRVSIS
jgi:Mg-chelatase subunit ChlD